MGIIQAQGLYFQPKCYKVFQMTFLIQNVWKQIWLQRKLAEEAAKFTHTLDIK